MITAAWKPLDPDLDVFLTEFERRSGNPESDSGEQFADQCLAADPKQAVMVSRDMLVAALPARRKMFQDAGVGTVRCVQAAQLDLDEQHVLVTADWDAERTGGQNVRLESTFLLRREEDGPRILVYLNHRDVAALLFPDAR
ncbi:hypothetical protein [Streptomyces sp. NBC_00079]|uniref:hypothetical protein n=1 Tax=Streptomyces sp. NBC_00079 TaxID=2975644 RepID=UPI0032454D59